MTGRSSLLGGSGRGGFGGSGTGLFNAASNNPAPPAVLKGYPPSNIKPGIFQYVPQEGFFIGKPPKIFWTGPDPPPYYDP